MRVVAMVLLFVSISSSAQTPLPKTMDEMRQSFSPLMHAYDAQFARAAKMRPAHIKVDGFAVDPAVCRALYPSIEKNYEFGPFDIRYNDGEGRGFGQICPRTDQTWTSVFSTVPGITSLGRPYGLAVFEILRQDSFEAALLDQANRIVEKAWVQFENDQVVWSTMSSTDTNGDVYVVSRGVKQQYPTLGINGPYSSEQFIAADGRTGSGGARHFTMTDAVDPSQTLERWEITRADVIDFTGVVILPTFVDAYFKYEKGFYNHPRSYSTYSVTLKNGVVVCERGYAQKPYGEHVLLPDYDGYSACH